MVPTADVILPETTEPFSDDGIVKLRSNFSGCSAMLSLVTVTLIVVVVVPAGKVEVIRLEV